ncbi:MAG: hypothetical protein ACLQO6_09040 [Desulfomonilaceae bacterium]
MSIILTLEGLHIIAHGSAMGHRILNPFPVGPLLRSNIRTAGVHGHKPSVPWVGRLLSPLPLIYSTK